MTGLKGKAAAIAAAGAASLLALPLTVSGASAAEKVTAAAAAPLPTVSYPVSFQVVDTDQTSLAHGIAPTIQVPLTLGGITLPGGGSNLPVPEVNGDGKTYTVQGHITAPAGALKASNPAATLYTHGHGYGEWLWRFTQVPGYNYAQTAAQAGLTSVTIDKLGYGNSSIVNGNDLGYGTEATIDHQILADLKTGSYTMNGKAGVKFAKTALAGAAQSVVSVELENQTYHDAKGLVLGNFADEGLSPSLIVNTLKNELACSTDAAMPGSKNGVPGYEYREVTTSQFNSDDLVDTAPAVVAAADALHDNGQGADPCGYPAYSVLQDFGQDNLLDAGDTNTPVVSVFGADDSELIVPVAAAFQKTEFALNPDVTIHTDPGVGQDLTLGTNHAIVDSQFTTWLCQRNFGAGTNGSCTAGLTAAVTNGDPAAATPSRTANRSVGSTEAAAVTSTPVSGNGASLAATGRDLPREIETAFVLLLSGIILVTAAGLMVSDQRKRT